MARSVPTDELEHLDLAASPRADPHPGPRRRTGIITLVVLLVAGTLGLGARPARITLARAGFRHADRILVTSQSLALNRQRLLGILFSRSSPEDADRVRRARARLDRELEDRYVDLRRSLGREWRLRLDGQTNRFRAAVVRALAAPDGSREAEQRASALRERWRVAKPRVEVAGLHSADKDVAALRRYVDRPTGVRLVIGTRDGLTELDLDRSRRRNARSPGLAADAPGTLMVPRDGWLAFSDRGHQGWGVSDRLGPPLAAFGTGEPLESAGPDTLWFWETNTHTVKQVDSTSRVVAGPYGLPIDSTGEEYRVVGVAAAGVVILHKGVTEVWDPVSARVLRRLAGPAFAVGGDLVFWVDGESAVMFHVTDLAKAADVATISYTGNPAIARFAPDGSLLAFTTPTGIAVFDIAQQRIDHLPDDVAVTSLTWDPSSRWLFFQAGVVGGWDTVRHEAFHPRLPGILPGWVLLAALPS